MSYAALFPGQGSQSAGMGELARQARPDLVQLVTELVGADPFAHVEEGTRFAQPAIFVASLAGWSLMAGEDRPECGAGHSLGDLTALVAAGALAEQDGLRAVVHRAALTHEAARADGGGAMLAVMVGRDAARELTEEFGLALANDNGPTQVVLSGAGEAVDAARRAAAERGIKAVRLKVGGAFHSPAMTPAVPRFREVLDRLEFRTPRFPVVSSSTAAPFEDDPRPTLAEALTRPVRWRDSMDTLHRMGIRRFVETGPGSVLSKLIHRSYPDVQVGGLPAGARA